VIVFSAYQSDSRSSQIVAVRPDGTGSRTLGTFPGHPWRPRLSPDGTTILFASAAPERAGWPADNDLNGSGSPDIWIAGVDGSGARRLTDATAGYNGWAWSRDGRWIAFASNRDGDWAIYKMTATGTQLTRLTTTPAQDAWPAWTPDGTGIVFASTRSDFPQIYRMDADGGHLQRLVTSKTADSEPAIAPDGATIAYAAQAVDGTGEIYLAGSDGASPRRLTSVGGLNTSAVWSPDGKRLAFVCRHDGRSDLYVVNADGSGLTRLTNAGENRYPDWSAATIGRAPQSPGSPWAGSSPGSVPRPLPDTGDRAGQGASAPRRSRKPGERAL
jgi:TolB protein